MEELLQEVVNVLVVIVEACGAAVIIVGAVWAFMRFVWMGLRHRSAHGFVPVRLTLGRFLALGLEFQLASDVLRTAVAPSWEEIGQLAAIAAIRTVLNYFLGKEIAEERRQVEEDRDRPSDAGGGISTAGGADQGTSTPRTGRAG
ncbi:DUF1622 domain-containing protein [Blastococcus sp. SYSU DS0539]